jgi:GNAT superfamily N-acetyltransferase
VATGVRPRVAGKPERALFEAVAAALGGGSYLMVGDRADTDLAGARTLGWGTALVLTGVTRPATLLDLPAAPDHLLADAGGLLAPPGPAIRPATAADAPAVAALLGEALATAAAGGDGRLALVAHDGAEVVGAVACRWSGERARLEGLAVQPPWRGRLVGARLLLAACIRLRVAGVRRLRAGGGAARGQGLGQDLEAAAAFLERLGFAPEGSGALARDLPSTAQ